MGSVAIGGAAARSVRCPSVRTPGARMAPGLAAGAVTGSFARWGVVLVLVAGTMMGSKTAAAVARGMRGGSFRPPLRCRCSTLLLPSRIGDRSHTHTHTRD